MGAFLTRLRHKLTRSLKDRGSALTLARLPLAPYYMAREYLRARDSFDGQFGVDTEAEPIPPSERGPGWVEWVTRGGGYGPVKPEIFCQAVKSVGIKYEDFAFVDLGSGKGRAMLLASEFPFREIVGIELSPKLQETARTNICKYKTKTQKCKEFRLVEADFTNCPLPSGRLLLYFFNPCHAPEMQKLVGNIRARLEAEPRETYLLYVNPVLGHIVDEANFASKVKQDPRFLIYKFVHSKAV